MAWNPSPEVAAARDYGVKFHKDQVIILALDQNQNTLQAVSYGKTRTQCAVAKHLSDAAYRAVEAVLTKAGRRARAQRRRIAMKHRLINVWAKFIHWADDNARLDEVKERLDNWLDELHGDDEFGTEGQCDPRGDGRDVETRPRI